ncbi:15178_t:CDS:2 [Funneliformis mosseae]|uniref:15178_t:CDS:1 n=1 Tax=Funneliformis mosseae TaxID=27381 RepID=A0A9N9H1I4_FUNMO|nr:15178_t:CDS:2 [Funneliformis mosseae]
MDRENEPMSETAILPLVDVVKKEWKKDDEIKGEQGGKKEGTEDLKRHFDEIAERLEERLDHKIDGVSHEMKKVRLQSEVMWYSAPGTDTETDKGIFVGERGTETTFPLKLTTTTQRRVYGKFKYPPSPDVPEKTLQEYFIDECKPLQKSKDSKLVVEDVHSIPLLATRKPDFVFIAKGHPLDALRVVAVGEIRKRSSNNFTNADIGHAVSFGEKVLQLQPRRAYVYVLLTDCRLVCIYKVTRCNSNIGNNIRFSYEYISPANLNYESSTYAPAGWKYLVTIMESDPEKLGWIDPSLKFDSDTVKLVRSINTGRTSIVYEGKLNDKDPVVVKLAKEEKYLSCFEREKNVLENFKSPHFPKLLLYDKNSLVTTPLGTKVKNMQKKDVRNIIDTLRMAHSQNIVHMDLRRYNFIRDHDEKIFIIDWGYSATRNETGNFAGALECMPDDILKLLADGKQILYSPRIDLICLVRSFYLMLHKPANTAMERISFDKIPNFKSRAKNVLTFWSSHGKSDIWQKIHQEANDLNYDNLIKELERLF